MCVYFLCLVLCSVFIIIFALIKNELNYVDVKIFNTKIKIISQQKMGHACTMMRTLSRNVQPERATETSISDHHFVEQIDAQSFSFIRCLHIDDQALMKKKYSEYLNRTHNTTTNSSPHLNTITVFDSICLKDWVEIMEECTHMFNHKYFLYRQSYSGENFGIQVISHVKDNHVSKVKIFGNMSRPIPIHLVIAGNRIERVDVPRESNYVNLNMLFWNEREILV